jgi:hypothetical protein
MSERVSRKRREPPTNSRRGRSNDGPSNRFVDLEEVPEDLREPIAALLWLMRETIARAQTLDDYEALVSLMEKYSVASTRLAGLLKSQRGLAEEQGMSKTLRQALDKVLEDMAARGQHL